VSEGAVLRAGVFDDGVPTPDVPLYRVREPATPRRFQRRVVGVDDDLVVESGRVTDAE